MKYRKYIYIFLIILLYHQKALAQSTYLPIPDNDIFLNLSSSSNYFSLLGLYVSAGLILAGPIYSLFFLIFPLSKTKNRQNWGKVLNSSTEEPIDKAKVFLNIYTSNTIHTRVVESGGDGSYGFKTKKGLFSLRSEINHFHFPPKNDEGLYKGDRFVISDSQENPNIDLYMDPLYDTETTLKAKLYYYGQRIGVPALIIFTLISLYYALYFPSVKGIIFLCLYAVIWAVLIVITAANINKSIVISKETKLPLLQAYIKILDSNNKVIVKKMTNDMGHFDLRLDPGEYKIMVSRPRFNSVSESIVVQENKKFRLRIVLKGLIDKS